MTIQYRINKDNNRILVIKDSVAPRVGEVITIWHNNKIIRGVVTRVEHIIDTFLSDAHIIKVDIEE